MNKIEKTQEQKEIISSAKKGNNIIIQAFAGCAKTSTLKMLSTVICKETLYIAFNSEIASEARKDFPEWTDCRTVHSIAYEYIVKGTKYRPRLSGFYPFQEAKKILSSYIDIYEEETQYMIISNVQELIKEYCQSSCFKLCDFVKGYIKGNVEFAEDMEEEYINMSNHLWNCLTNKQETWKIGHDLYLKMFQLSKPDLSNKYKIILLDEMQDSNPVTLDIFYRQQGKVQLIGVGDKYQGIYAWRGAVDAMLSVPEGFITKYLSTNFRFNQDLADQANRILSYMGEEKGITGMGNLTELTSKAVLVRNNSTLFNYLIQAANEGKKVFAIADLKDLFSQMYTAASLLYCKKSEKPKFGPYPHKKIAAYSTWKELVADKSPDVRKIANLVAKCQPTVHAAITKARSCLVENEELADITLVTGHKSKGREWDEVTLSNDFLPVVGEYDTIEEKIGEFISEQGMNLCYVAVTRARVKVNLSPEWEDFLKLLNHLKDSFAMNGDLT